MVKAQERIYKIHPWKIIEQGFQAEQSQVSESIFSLANEYMGIRGYFEEGYGGETLLGSYLNGVFEELELQPSGYKGIANQLAFLVNTLDWLYLRLFIDGEQLDLAESKVSQYRRELHLKTGLLTREFIWETVGKKKIKIRLERFLSMATPEYGYQRVRLTPLNFSGQAELIMGLDFATVHKTIPGQHWHTFHRGQKDGIISLAAQTTKSKKALFAGFKLEACPEGAEYLEGPDFAGLKLNLDLVEAKPLQLAKKIGLFWEDLACDGPAKFIDSASLKCSAGLEVSWSQAWEEQVRIWRGIWQESDVEIEGDLANQQGIRYCIFQLQQTFRGINPGANIGAKGLTGEFYNGHAFWDTETYCLPFYLFSNPAAARNLLLFRYAGLERAKERALDLDCQGAFYPIATLDGRENCTLWQHSNLQLQATTAVAYGIWHYHRVVRDTRFLHDEGLEMLVEICRLLKSRAQAGQRSGKVGYFGVMGPDEFQLMVNHNCYTNFMAKQTLLFTLDVLQQLQKEEPGLYGAKMEKLGVKVEELDKWARLAQAMYIPLEEETGLYEQHQGFFDLPHQDLKHIPVEQFPLCDHWSYERIYRNDMIKQPDVLMFMFLYNQMFSLECKRKNYEYYAKRTVHESSLSPAIHSVLAAELGKEEEALSLFQFATRLDLDNYNRNTEQGLHLTSIAAAWLNVVYGFGGMRSDGPLLSFQPTIPRNWQAYSFKVSYRGALIAVEITSGAAYFSLLAGEEITVLINGERQLLTAAGLTVALESENRRNGELRCGS